MFYVHGNAYNNIDIQLALLADKNSTVYFDNVRIENVIQNFNGEGNCLPKEEDSEARTLEKRIIGNLREGGT